jgi:hypothetical protein
VAKSVIPNMRYRRNVGAKSPLIHPQRDLQAIRLMLGVSLARSQPCFSLTPNPKTLAHAQGNGGHEQASHNMFNIRSERAGSVKLNIVVLGGLASFGLDEWYCERRRCGAR